jgi:hypothetical protein
MDSIGFIMFLGFALIPPYILYRSFNATLLGACFLGWIPGNLIASIHLGIDTNSFYNFLMIFLFLSACQYGLVRIVYDTIKENQDI